MINCMELKLNRTKIKFDVYGQIIECTKPIISELKDLEKKIEEVKLDNEGSEKVIRDFLTTRGFTNEILDSLEMEHFLQIIETFSAKKKP